jgi:hypothetical protein
MTSITDLNSGQSGHVNLHKAIRSRLLSVYEYGAVGDGSHDDTSAIQSAINAASGRLSLPDTGIFKITSSLIISNPLTIEGQRATLSGSGLSDNPIINIAANDVHLLGLNFINANYGVIAASVYWTRIEHCWFDYIGKTGVVFNLANASTVENSRFNLRNDGTVGLSMISSNASCSLNSWYETAKNGSTFVSIFGAMSMDCVLAFNRFEGHWNLDNAETPAYCVSILPNFPEPTIWKPQNTKLIANQYYPQQTLSGVTTENHTYDISDGGEGTVVV